MFRQSIWIIITQVLNVSVGTFLTFYVAANVSPAKYGVFALYQIVTTFMAAFSFMGHETHLIRNALAWKSGRRLTKIRINVTKALIARLVMWFLLLFPVYIYIFFVSKENYSDEFLVLIYLFPLAGLFTSVTQCSSLILRSLNKYLEAVLITVLGLLVVKTVSVVVFLHYGFAAHMYVLIFGGGVISVVAFFRIRKFFKISLFKFRNLYKVRRRVSFIATAHVQYLTNYADRMLVAIFAPPDILGSYNIAKQIQEIGKLLLEGFFDPITQRLVAFRRDANELQKQLTSIVKVQGFLILVSTPLVLGFLWLIDDVLSMIGLYDYPHIKIFVIFSGLSSFLYLACKVQVNFNSYMLPPPKLFQYNLVVFAISLFSFFMVERFLDESLLYSNRLAIEFSILFYNYHLFRVVRHEKNIHSIL